MSEPTFPRTFVAQRDADVSGVSGEGIVAEGVQFSDGWAVTHWLDRPPMHEPKTDVWHNPGTRPFERVHGHDGATRVVWADEYAQQRARTAALITEAFDVPPRILGFQGELDVLRQQIEYAIQRVQDGEAAPAEAGDERIVRAVMPIVELLLQERTRAQQAAGRAYQLADRWQAAHGSSVLLVRAAGDELRDELDGPETRSDATGTPLLSPVLRQRAQQARADEDAHRIARRRDSILNLLAGLERGPLTAEETALLRNHIADEGIEHDTVRAILADHRVENRALRQKLEQEEDLLRVAHETSNRAETERAIAARRAEEYRRLAVQRGAELAEAQAALDRVRLVGPQLEYKATAPGMAEPAREVLRDASRRIRTALEGTAQQHNGTAATEATGRGVCNAYRPPTTPEDSGLCARCGMYDYRHPAETEVRP
jgi:hypothetical protein